MYLNILGHFFHLKCLPAHSAHCEASQKCIFHYLNARAILLPDHFVAKQQQAVRRNGDFLTLSLCKIRFRTYNHILKLNRHQKKISKKLTVGGDGGNPYGQPDCKKTVFYDSPYIFLLFLIFRIFENQIGITSAKSRPS